MAQLYSDNRTSEEIELTAMAVDTVTAANMLGISPGTLENMRYCHDGVHGPRFARVGRKIVYPVAELQRYLDESMIPESAMHGSRRKGVA